jgi:hypothetical protein
MRANPTPVKLLLLLAIPIGLEFGLGWTLYLLFRKV